jgi:hypothetical protein
MIRFKKSESLQRKIRQDDLADLGISTETLVRQAIQAGRADEALEFLGYCLAEHQEMHNQVVAFVIDTLTYLSTLGEEEVEKAIRHRYDKRVRDWLSSASTLMEAIPLFTEYQRGHFGSFAVVEEADRYVISHDPCGSGHKLWRIRGEGNIATTKKAYPWSWSRSGVPYYCVHCSVVEQIATEAQGYPVSITLSPEKPEDSCVHLYYKKPELIPEEYFTRIGKTKTIK